MLFQPPFALITISDFSSSGDVFAPPLSLPGACCSCPSRRRPINGRSVRPRNTVNLFFPPFNALLGREFTRHIVRGRTHLGFKRRDWKNPVCFTQESGEYDSIFLDVFRVPIQRAFLSAVHIFGSFDSVTRKTVSYFTRLIFFQARVPSDSFC